MKGIFLFLKIVIVAYVLICVLLYFMQEKLIFFPEKLPEGHVFQFQNQFEEINVKTADNVNIHGLLFRAERSKGLVFYLHGNAGSVRSWGDVASTYTVLGYDVFIPDYRGYGKSTGSIHSEQQFYNDMQLAYDSLKNRQPEKDIIIMGYSIGTGAATRLAAANHPRLLVLHAPYYSLTDMMHHRFRIVPSFILKYKFATNTFLPQCQMPVVIFHGDRDEIIYYGSSIKLEQLFKRGDTLITLQNQGHNGISENPEYIAAIQKLLQ